VPLPQDYVNYVNVSWIDSQGVKHVIYPTTLTTNPYETLSQDTQGIAIQDNLSENINTTSITEDRWAKNDLKEINDAQSNLTGMLLSDGLVI
jgi:ABC-type Zn uptake system ZnuABC Zn-binding protein ZnuA